VAGEEKKQRQRDQCLKRKIDRRQRVRGMRDAVHSMEPFQEGFFDSRAIGLTVLIGIAESGLHQEGRFFCEAHWALGSEDMKKRAYLSPRSAGYASDIDERVSQQQSCADSMRGAGLTARADQTLSGVKRLLCVT